MELNFRTLKENEISVRVGATTYDEKQEKYGVSLLLYKDARVDMALLDEQLKPWGWCRDHKEVKGVMYCGVGLRNEETGEWIFKWDAGTESNSDEEKGEASDSFKRACVNWGIGRELYTAPFIWVELLKKDFCQRNGKMVLQNYIKFKVKEIHYDECRKIDKLIIVDNRGAVVFSFPKNAYVEQVKQASKPTAQPQQQSAPQAKQSGKAERNEPLTAEQLDNYMQLCSDMDAAQTFQQLAASVTMATGQPYEDKIRAKANDICKLNGWRKEQ